MTEKSQEVPDHRRYHVTYYYYASGMETGPDEKDYGFIYAESPEEACRLIALQEWPVDEMYGRDNQLSTRDWVYSRLTATLAEP